MKQQIHQFCHSTIDMVILRLSVVMIFLVFGNAKWFEFEVELLKPMISHTWLNVLYELFGYYGASYFLGVVESMTYLFLIIGFFKPKFGVLGSVLVIITGLVTLSMLPQLGFNGFIFKDILLIGTGVVLLKYDLNRVQTYH